jgi:phage regulator Rha-like protein
MKNKKVQLTIMVDADHGHCQVTRRSVFINSTPLRCFSKMQKTVETSTYGSELVAARIATDIAMEFRYSIRMMGFD